jgi:hypothetical protein
MKIALPLAASRLNHAEFPRLGGLIRNLLIFLDLWPSSELSPTAKCPRCVA